MAISMTCKTCVCSRPTSTNSPKATKIEPTTKSGGTMSMNNKSRMVASRGLFSTVRKKLMRSKLPRKNIIIIHNNTSITSNEEDNRTSCVEVKDIAAIKDDQGKDSNQTTNPLPTSSPPPAGQKKSSTTAANNTNCAIGVVPPAAATVDGSAAPSPSAATDPAAAAASLISTHFDHNSINNSDIGSEIRDDKEAPTADNNNNNRINKEEKGQKIANIEAAQRQLEAAQKELEAAQRELEAATKEKASIRIQATFRGHLSRRAFWALKSLVKLQAVVRGASVRRQQRMALHCMHAMVRLQVRVRARQFLSTKSISQESN